MSKWGVQKSNRGMGRFTIERGAMHLHENYEIKEFSFFTFSLLHNTSRSSVTEIFYKKMFLENSLRPATLSKKRVWHSCFTVNYAKFPWTPFLTEHLRRLLLCVIFQLYLFKRLLVVALVVCLNVVYFEIFFMTELFIACSKFHFRKDSRYINTSQLNDSVNHLTGFYLILPLSSIKKSFKKF